MTQLVIDLIQYIQSLGIFAYVNWYRNELAQGSAWTPVYPSAFIRPQTFSIAESEADGSVSRFQASISIYIVERVTPVDRQNSLAKAEILWSNLNGTIFDSLPNMTVTPQNIQFVDSAYNTEIYLLTILVK